MLDDWFTKRKILTTKKGILPILTTLTALHTEI